VTGFDAESLDFTKGQGLITVVAQDATTGRVLMVAHADREALDKTVETGEMHYTSRSRGLWHKGATSGNTQRVVSLSADCDRDAVVARVIPAGPACHTGTTSCFENEGWDVMSDLDQTISSRAQSASDGSSYTQRLLNDRNLRLKKLGEEATELAVACADGDAERATEEAADLIYHALTALRSIGVGFADVERVLASRHSTGARKA
jgi:phosphoribosyl-ATP pyrophosphohydrolase/phosphoribosyl-AMP cyclohydrolase